MELDPENQLADRTYAKFDAGRWEPYSSCMNPKYPVPVLVTVFTFFGLSLYNLLPAHGEGLK
jgi:hypothetical protein